MDFMAPILAIMIFGPLSIALGFPMVIAGIGRRTPFWAKIGLVPILPLSVWAAVDAWILSGYDSFTGSSNTLLPLLVFALVPLLLAFYAIWAHAPAAQAAMPPHRTSAVVLGLVGVLSIGQIAYLSTASRREHLADEQELKQEAEREATMPARYRRLTAASPLAEWEEFISLGEGGMKTEALARARALPHRQAEAEALLKRGDAFPLAYRDRLDLKATPQFCAAAIELMRKDAAEHRSTASHRGIAWWRSRHSLVVDWQTADRWEVYVDKLGSLIDHCDLGTAPAAVAETVRSYPAELKPYTTVDPDELLAELARLRVYNDATRLDPKSETDFRTRGEARFFGGHFPAAAEDFTKASALAPADPYTMLWLYLARARAGQSPQPDLRRAAAPLDRTAWPWPLVAAYLGDQDGAAVQAAAARGEPGGEQHRRCEAAFYLGEAAMLDDAMAARHLLYEAGKTCRPAWSEFTAARLEFARLPQ